MKTIWGGDNSITIPNTFFCTKSRYAYVKVVLEEPLRNQDVTLEVYDVANEDASKITIARKTDDRGVAIFPIGAVCESLVKEYGEGIVVMFNASYPGGGVGYSSHRLSDMLTMKSKPSMWKPKATRTPPTTRRRKR